MSQIDKKELRTYAITIGIVLLTSLVAHYIIEITQPAEVLLNLGKQCAAWVLSVLEKV